MGAPKGTAFLHVRDEMQALIEPLIVGHGWFPDKRSERPLYDYVEMFGTRDIAAFLTVPAAIDYMAAHNWVQVRERCFAMALDAKRTVEGMFGTPSICPEGFEWFSQLCPIRLPDNTDMDKLSAIMHDEYKIEMPLITWNNYKIARLSVQIYTTQDEIDALVEMLTTHVVPRVES